MPYDAPGKRVEVIYDGGSDGKTPLPTNTFAVVDNKVLLLAKTSQLGRYVDPTSDEAIEIQPDELCVGFQGGVHELALSGALATASRGDKLWIDSADNSVLRASGGGTGGSDADEVQTLKVEATGGTFTLAWEGQKTSKIKWNASAAEVQAALEALENINPGDVTVTGGPGDEKGTKLYEVTFGGRYENTDVAELTAEDELTGDAEKVTVATKTAGAGSSDVAMPLGVIDEIDATRTPHMARVNTDAWQAFITS
jgi:hypothetical protein